MSWGQRFSGEEYLFGVEPAQTLVKLEKYLVPNGRTLVVADGEGRNSVYLASKGFYVVGTDFSKVGIDKAKALAAQKNVGVDYKHCDIYDQDWSAEKYDNVVAIFIQFVKPQKVEAVFQGLQSALKQGGTLLIHGYTPEQVKYGTGGPTNPERMYTEELLASSFANMNIKLNKAYHAEISEGTGHSGQSALIDFVAEAVG
jgi:cyclopropane fatty-acyl-phospholipid synthase-like methyltransferase